MTTQMTEPRPAQQQPPPHHDEIPTDLPKIRTHTVLVVAAAAVLLLGILFLVGFIPHRLRTAEAEKVAKELPDKPIVDVTQPRRADSGGDIVLPADARALQETPIYPRANGYLKKLLVDIGDRVKTGQLLAELDTPEIDAQLNQARAAVEQAKANQTKAKADYELAKTTLTRYEQLSKTDGGRAVPEQDLDEKRGAFNQAKAAVDASAANVTAEEAAVQRLVELQGFKNVTAPFGGIISARNYDIGALLSPSNTGEGKELFRLTQSDTLRVFVNVPQAYASSIKMGQPASLEVRNFPGRKFAGKVVRSSGSIDPSTRTMRTQIDIPNPDLTLWAGMYGQVTMPLTADTPPLLVPTSSMMFDTDGTKVVLVEDGRAAFKKIRVGRDLGQELEVVEGLSGNEQVVTNPGERLKDGIEVEIAPRKDQPAAPPKVAQR